MELTSIVSVHVDRYGGVLAPCTMISAHIARREAGVVKRLMEGGTSGPNSGRKVPATATVKARDSSGAFL